MEQQLGQNLWVLLRFWNADQNESRGVDISKRLILKL